MSLQSGDITAISGAIKTVVDGLTLTFNQSLSIGFNAAPLSIGSWNTYLGYNSARFSVNGSYNTTLGSDTGYMLGSSYNTIIGFSAARFVSTGGNNTVLGATAGGTAEDGSNNTLVGGGADVVSGKTSLAVALGAAAVAGPSAVAINIADRIVGHQSNDVAGHARYSVMVNADLTRLGRALAFPAPLDATTSPTFAISGPPAWCMYTAASRTSNGGADLVFRSANHVVTRITDEFRPGVLNFTGQHRCTAAEPLVALGPGLIVVATSAYMDLCGRGGVTEMDEAVPVVALCRHARDPRVFGVVCATEELSEENRREFWVGSIVTEVPVSNGEAEAADRCCRRVIVNSSGEGGIWVCGLNGPIRNGDLITSTGRGYAPRRRHRPG
eukprot:gene3342-13369_t